MCDSVKDLRRGGDPGSIGGEEGAGGEAAPGARSRFSPENFIKNSAKTLISAP